jgi:predicted metal-dependent HD superfamily phosphohydrolase
MATRSHNVGDEDPDARLLVDIDLAILGSAPARFDEYERQVRREYGHVSDENWRVGRARVLQSFLARPRIYATDAYRDALESRARDNLSRSLAALS